MVVKENFFSTILRKHSLLRALAAFWTCVGKSALKPEEKSKQNEEDLRLILDSIAERIYGIDLEGKCTMCNASCLSMLGYSHERQLLGKNMHDIIHNKYPDGTYYPEEQCRILQAFKKGQGTHVEDEVFWRADGTCFPVEYFSYPQYRNGRVIGAVVTFSDITE
jgi:PAS domain S-box-containing protein